MSYQEKNEGSELTNCFFFISKSKQIVTYFPGEDLPFEHKNVEMSDDVLNIDGESFQLYRSALEAFIVLKEKLSQDRYVFIDEDAVIQNISKDGKVCSMGIEQGQKLEFEHFLKDDDREASAEQGLVSLNLIDSNGEEINNFVVWTISAFHKLLDPDFIE